MKRELVRELLAHQLRHFAALIRTDSKTYGSAAVKAVKALQARKHLEADGVVGEDTWRALGVHEPVVDVRPVLHGVPFEPGVTAVDSNWVDSVLAQEILARRKAGRWSGSVLSGFRPPWYQKRLFDQAVQKYGSVEKARKFVAPPGKSHHGMKGGQGAVDVTPSSTGAELDRDARLFRPMDWEPWHVQLEARGMPAYPDGEPSTEVPDSVAKELDESGVTMDDIDETIAVYLDRLDTVEPVGDR
jgi:hypothetical protein